MTMPSYRTRAMRAGLRTTNANESFVCPNGRTRRTCGAHQQSHHQDGEGVKIRCLDCGKFWRMTRQGWETYEPR